MAPSDADDPDLRGVAVFVGSSELARPIQEDHFRTVFPRADGVEMSGVEVAATAYANLLEGSTLRPLGPAPAFVLVCALGVLLGGCAYSLPPRAAFAATAALAVAYAAFASLLFNTSAIWLPMAVPMLVVLPGALLAGGVAQVSRARRQRADAETAREAAVAANAARSAFVATVSHEIRTLLGWVTGLVERLDSADLDDVERGVVARVRQFSDSLLQLLNDVLDLAKMEAGELRIAPEIVALRPLIRSVVDMLRPAATAKGLTLSFDITDAVPQAVLADPLRICQILWNLAGNAVKFTDRGHVRVRLDAERDAGDQTMLVLSVADTGIGIPEAVQSTLFVPFRQADATTARRYGGSGLGLSIVARLAGLMGGTITLLSRPEEGSTFTVRLPVAVMQAARDELVRFPHTFMSLADHPPAELAPTPLPAPVRDHPGPDAGEVLVAEDDPLNRLLIEGQLISFGMTVRMCPGGDEAWSELRQRRPHVLITDLHMPSGLSGIELTRRIRADPGFASLRIIGLTADARPDSIQSCIDAGMDRVLLKPLKLPDLPNAFLRLGIPCGAPAVRVREAAADLALEPEKHDDPVFDPANLVLAFGSLDARSERIISDFMEQAKELISETKCAAAGRDAAAVRRTAHRMAGCSASIGATRLGRAFGKIATAGTLDWSRVDSVVGTLDGELAEVAQAVAGLVAGRTGQAAFSNPSSDNRRSSPSG